MEMLTLTVNGFSTAVARPHTEKAESAVNGVGKVENPNSWVKLTSHQCKK